MYETSSKIYYFFSWNDDYIRPIALSFLFISLLKNKNYIFLFLACVFLILLEGIEIKNKIAFLFSSRITFDTILYSHNVISSIIDSLTITIFYFTILPGKINKAFKNEMLLITTIAISTKTIAIISGIILLNQFFHSYINNEVIINIASSILLDFIIIFFLIFNFNNLKNERN